jgi:hypothetical protein
VFVIASADVLAAVSAATAVTAIWLAVSKSVVVLADFGLDCSMAVSEFCSGSLSAGVKLAQPLSKTTDSIGKQIKGALGRKQKAKM